MKILHSIEEMTFDPRTVVTVGSFDGVHRGHQEILRYVTTQAQAMQGRSVVITFSPHPRDVVGKGPVEHLSTLEERLRHLEQFGIDETLIIHFTYEFSLCTAEAFYTNYIVKRIGVREVVIGHDHIFGRNREGGEDLVRRLGKEHQFDVMVIPGVSIGETVISSSLIRKTLKRGEVESAAVYLGRPYSISAMITEGDKRGRQLGFPTANLQYDRTAKLTPAQGVYIVEAGVGNRQVFGMLNIGTRPTFNTNGQELVEVHLLQVENELYNEPITVSFLKRLRSEQHFNSAEDLVAQLRRDRLETETFVSTLHN